MTNQCVRTNRTLERAFLAVILGFAHLALGLAAAQPPYHSLPLAPVLQEELRGPGPVLVAQDERGAGAPAFAILRLPMPFSCGDDDARKALVSRVAALAGQAAQAGWTGVALDIAADSPRGPGPRSGEVRGPAPADQAENRARSLGRELRRTIEAGSDTAGSPLQILCIEDGAESTGRLWYALLAGLLGEPPNDRAPVHVITRATRDAIYPAAFLHEAAAVRQRLRWHTGLGPKLNGAVRIGFAVRSDPPLDARLPLILAARCYSETYALLDGAADALAPAEAPQLPFDLGAAVRLGPLTREDLVGYALRGEDGCALLLWGGSDAPLQVGPRTQPLSITDLQTGATNELAGPPSGVEVPPHDGAVLVYPLPMVEWGLPACLWATLDAGGLANALPCEWGVTNRTGFTLAGSVAATVSRHAGIRPSVQRLDLDPNTDVVVSSLVRGAFRPGATVEVGLSLHPPTGPAVAALFRFPCYQRATHAVRLRSPITAPPLFIPAEADPDGPQIVAVSEGGDVVCLRADGTVRWSRRAPESFSVGPVLARDWQGTPLIITCDDGGSVDATYTSGLPAWRADLGGAPSDGPICVGHLHGFPGVEIAVPREDGTVTLLLNTGQTLRQVRVEGRNPRLAVGSISDQPGAALFVLSEGDEAVLTSVEHGGKERWKQRVRMTPSCPPLFFAPDSGDAPASSGAVVVVGSTRGTIQVRDAAGGALRQEIRVPDAFPVLGIATADLGSNVGWTLIATTAGGVYGYSLALEPLWSQPIACSGPAHVVPLSVGPGILAPGVDGRLHLLTATGDSLWANPEATGALVGEPASGPGGAESEVVAAYVSTDGGIRLLPVEAPSRP